MKDGVVADGALGNSYFRFFTTRLAEGITLSGQLAIQWVQRDLNDFINKILKTKDADYCLASDTDSVYFTLGSFVQNLFPDGTDKEKIVDFLDKFCEDYLQKEINRSYQQLAIQTNAYDQKMIMKRESIADVGVWTAKKRYMLNVLDSEGVRYKEPKLKIMGIETARSSTPEVCRNKLKTAIKKILNSTQSEVLAFIEDFRQEFLTLQPEQVAFPRGVNGLDKYSNRASVYIKGTPIHVKGALMFNHLIQERHLGHKYELIKEGEKIRFLYLKLPNPVKETVISFPSVIPKEFGLEDYVDYEMQFEKTFLDPLKTIMETIGWSLKNEATLDTFFGD